MTLAHKHEPRVGRLALAALAAIVALSALAPSASAAFGGGAVPVVASNHCTNASCITNAALEALANLVRRAIDGITQLVGGIVGGFVDIVIRPFLEIFGGFFVGIGLGLRELGEGLFGGAGDALAAGYKALEDSLGVFGIFAPIIAVAIVMVAVGIVFIAVQRAIAQAVDILPAQAEEAVKDEVPDN